MHPQSLLEEMVDRIDGLEVAERDLDAAGVLIGDALACIIGAQHSPAAEALLRWGRTHPESTQAAALVLGGLSSVLEMDAMDVPSSVHPGAVVVPAALATAAAIGASGATVARAVLRGTEAALRIGRSTGSGHRRNYQSTATCGGMGAAFACAELLGLGKAQSVDAMGLVGSTAGGVWAFLEEDSATKQWHCGHAASDAVLAAELAGARLRGPHRLFDSARGFHAVLCAGGIPAELTFDRTSWLVHGASFKPWPSPRPTHATITATLKAHAVVAGRPIERVTLKTFGMAIDLCNHDPIRTEHDARFSLRHCAAVALTDGSVDFESFERASIERQAALVERIHVTADEAMTAAYPAQSRASVELRLSEGQVITERVEHALGDPEMPLSAVALRQKQARLIGRTSVDNVALLLEALSAINRPTVDIADVLAQGLQPSGLRFVRAG